MLIFSGQFQPFHNGHLNAVQQMHKLYPNEKICIAIIKDAEHVSKDDEFDKKVKIRLQKQNNPFNSALTLKMIHNTLKTCPELKKCVLTTIIPYPNRDNFQRIVVNMLDCNDRTWCFLNRTADVDDWEVKKSEFYKSLGEKTTFINAGDIDISGTKIRQLISEQKWDQLKGLMCEKNIELIKNFKTEEKNQVFNFGGRYQPFHKGHMAMIKQIDKMYPGAQINICIIKDVHAEEGSSFNAGTRERLKKENAPYNCEQVMSMINSSICYDEQLSKLNITYTLIPYPNYDDWKTITQMLDYNRVWTFTGYKDKPDMWEHEKAKFFKEQNENFIFVPIETKDISGTEIRECITRKDYQKLTGYVGSPVCEIIKANARKDKLL